MSPTVMAPIALALPSMQQIYITKPKFVNTISEVDAIMEMNAGNLMSPPIVTWIMKMLVNVREHGVDVDITKIKGVTVDEEDGLFLNCIYHYNYINIYVYIL